MPTDVESEGNTILKDVDKTLSTYIIGQFIISIVIGTLMYIGYLIIGLDYALVLALFAMIFTVVPFLGPLISIIPALFIALQQDIGLAVKVLIVLTVVQQVEGHLVTPNIMGKRLNIHPLTIILLLLAAGSIYGFIGILIAIPTYSVVKTIIGNFRKFYNLRKRVA
ncbi:AI-2E family transporter [Peribacillus phoenicis]|uniref:AI-2E family transporter n=1 Tax=Peribacillus sp. 1P06PA-2 TaxID=3132295 RepID=UPI0039A757CD